MLCIIYGHAFDSKCAKPSSWLVNINFRKVAHPGEWWGRGKGWKWVFTCDSYVSSLALSFLELHKTDSPLGCKEIQPVHPTGDQSWVFIGRTDAEGETPILSPPDAKRWLIGKDPDAGKDWGQEEKGTTEDEMVGWHHLHNGHGFGWTLGVGDGQGGLACCSSWGRKESDTIERLNWTEDKLFTSLFFLS